MQDRELKAKSVSVRMKRMTVEYAYVSLLVTGEIMQTDDQGNVIRDKKGFAYLDPLKLIFRSTEQARQPSVKWYRESEQIEPHPVQKAPEANETLSTNLPPTR